MKQEQIIKIAKTIEINTEYLSSISEESKTLKYLNSLDFDSMPGPIKEMNINLLEQTKKNLDPAEQKELVKPNTETEKTDAEKYINSYFEIDKLLKESDITKSYETILSAEIVLAEAVTTKIKELLKEAEEDYKKSYVDLIKHIEMKIKEEYFGEKYTSSNAKKEAENKATASRVVQERKVEKRISYIVRKSRLSISEIRELLLTHIKKNALIYNKIIFEGKGVTLSVVDRILGITYKHGTGYIVNFISEPDSNFGRFYQNILKVFKMIKEKMYVDHEIVIEPEDGRGLIFLNSFYQNYMFIKDKLSSILLKYKLQNSMLNENFSIKHMIFNKNTNQYMIFYTGNKDLYLAAEQYLTNQAKLGPVTYTLDFVKLTGDSIAELMMEKYEKIINKIDLNSENNHLNIKQLSNEKNNESVVIRLSGVNILLDPVNVKKLDTPEGEEDLNIDVIILTHARKDLINEIPAIMMKFPNARLFTSDITYRIARINWLETINSSNTYDSPATDVENSLTNFTKKDIESLSERIIKITPEGKGYNFRRMVNIKFFNAGLIPGAAVVEFQDSKSKIIYLSDFNIENSGLVKGSDVKLENYDYILCKSGITDDETTKKLPVDLIKEKIENGKQVFLFSDGIGNLQHITSEITMHKFDYPIMSGNHIYGLINKEVAKLINFGSSWGENFQEKELFVESISCIQPFVDEYEFYKKFSTDNPLMFIVPFGNDELDMIIKNKLETGSIVVLPPYRLEAYNERLNKYTDIVDNDDIKNNKPFVYNYISKITDSNLAKEFEKSSKLKKVFLMNDTGFEKLSVNSSLIEKITRLQPEQEIEVYKL